VSIDIDEPGQLPRRLSVVPEDPVLNGPIGIACATLREAIDVLQAVDVAMLSEFELVTALDELETQARRIPTVRDALAAEAHTRGVAASRGFRSTGAWLRSRFRIGAGEARAWLRGAELLTPRRPLTGGEPIAPVLAATAAARAAGALSPAHVRVIDDFCDELPTALPPAARREAEAVMVDYAKDVGPVELTRFGQGLLDRLNPDGTEPTSADAHRRRGITIGPLRRGLARISGHVDAWTREAILTVLHSLSDHTPPPPPDDRQRAEHAEAEQEPADTQPWQPEPSADQPTGTQRGDAPSSEQRGDDPGASHCCGAQVANSDAAGGDQCLDGDAGQDHTDGDQLEPPNPPAQNPPAQSLRPQIDPDRRSHPQRLHDAIREACERLISAGGLPRRGGTTATILLTVPLQALEKRTGLISTAHGGDIPVAEVIRRAADSTIIPVVLDRVGNPLHLGRRQRLAGWQQRYALHVRDGGCVIPGCTVPSQDCHPHHIEDWASGGKTDIDNLALLCPYHHYRIHDWTLQPDDGRIWCTASPWLDRTGETRLNIHFRGPPPQPMLE